MPDRQERRASRQELEHPLFLPFIGHGDARVRDHEVMIGSKDERLRWSALPAVRDTKVRPAAGLHPHERRDRGRLFREWIDERRGTREQSTGAKLVPLDTLTGVIQERQKELRHRIRPRRVSKRLQDAGGGLIVAAQDRANTVLGRGLRRGRCGEQRQHA